MWSAGSKHLSLNDSETTSTILDDMPTIYNTPDTSGNVHNVKGPHITYNGTVNYYSCCAHNHCLLLNSHFAHDNLFRWEPWLLDSLLQPAPYSTKLCHIKPCSRYWQRHYGTLLGRGASSIFWRGARNIFSGHKCNGASFSQSQFAHFADNVSSAGSPDHPSKSPTTSTQGRAHHD